jgi:sulfite exporter TauE/SafE
MLLHLRRLSLSGQVINWLGEVSTYFPWVSFVAGLGGSLHCVGMCGGLVTATCEKSNDVFRYQVGRLLGYLALGAFAGLLANFLDFKSVHPLVSIIPALFIGLLFIFWGFQNYRGKKAELPAPKVFSRIYTKLWLKLVQKNKNFTKAFFTGLISIFLPCGLLYGVVLGTVALQHTHEALFSMFFFWLGTVPSMVVAPGIIQKVIRPFKSKLPKTFALSLMAIGVMTITLRMVKFRELSIKAKLDQTQQEMSCH